MHVPSGLRLAAQFLLRTESAGIAVPAMDGPLTPNDILDAARSLVEIPSPTDFVVYRERLIVASHNEILEVDAATGSRCQLSAFDAAVGAVAASDHALYAAVTGLGIVELDPHSRSVRLVVAHDLACPTALVPLADGSFVVALGSDKYAACDWVRDLMERRTSGSVIRLSTEGARPLAVDLAYPAGACLARDRRSVIVSEAWRHRLLAIPLEANGPVRTLLDNLPVYPGRLTAGRSGFWLTAFAARSHLIEFVLQETAFREEMMRSIDPDLWIRPHVRSFNSGLEPLQGGQLKKLGMMKPWAPARSYGLVVHLDHECTPTRSMHSRASGQTHGIMQARETAAGHLLLAVSSTDSIMELDMDAGRHPLEPADA